MILGIAWSYLSISRGWSGFTLAWIDPFGEIFIRLLKFIAIPLVLFSIISGITDLGDTKKLGRLGIKTLSTYLFTTVLAVSLGLVLVNVLKPGERAPEEQRITFGFNTNNGRNPPECRLRMASTFSTIPLMPIRWLQPRAPQNPPYRILFGKRRT